ncbi:MAG: hypothetical protein WCT99_02915 [Bacteroidota bacterium]|jgi:uncharacterized lipoprotein
MRKTMYLAFGAALIIAGCSQQDELEQKNKEMEAQLASKDRFIEEVTSSINEINSTMESAWAIEKNVVSKTSETEGKTALNTMEVKEKIIERISDVRMLLSENRRKIAALEKRLRGSSTQYTGLKKMVDELKASLDEREQSVAQLTARVQELESDVQEKAKVIAVNTSMIAERDSTIGENTRKLNTVYVVSGNHDELKDKGVIADEGGILWGLTGTTTVLASAFSDDLFQPIDRTSETIIPVQGTIDKIVPLREESSYAIEESVSGHSVLVIVKPEVFWREKHLAIVTD